MISGILIGIVVCIVALSIYDTIRKRRINKDIDAMFEASKIMYEGLEKAKETIKEVKINVDKEYLRESLKNKLKLEEQIK
ncbi:MAG: hypothetical protein KKH44_06070, partial [Bacteroidetes bacterium]|nr:hypothetical protein [Bacteroidota bacterium]